MHGKALINEALKGNPVERTPWVPYTGSQIANLKGYTAQEMFRDADKLYECCIEAESQYSPDGMTPMFDLQVEAEILGCDLAWYDNTPPTVCSHPLESPRGASKRPTGASRSSSTSCAASRPPSPTSPCTASSAARSPSPRTCAGPTSLWICTTMRMP